MSIRNSQNRLKNLKKGAFFSFLVITVLGVSMCSTGEGDDPETDEAPAVLAYLNLHDSVKYVGMGTCQSCHPEHHASFVHTGMGKSFDMATMQKSDASFGSHAVVYDPYSDFYYFPFWRDSTLMIREYRLKGGDTIHKREEAVEYIIGSGNHTNSHMVNFNGFVYQAPITYYTQEEKWDLAPGFENGNNTRFNRIISLECMSCHNGYPEFALKSENKFSYIPDGIDCERCHGPGETHVRTMLAGNTVDTATTIDYTIVNPGKLPRDYQMDLCQRCHLQGVAVLNPGKSFYDFKPGMRLNEVMNIFLPRFQGQENQFIMASQADRLRMSACYIESEMSCITCHNPHVSVKETPITTFNSKCMDCHNDGTCSVEDQEFALNNGNCVGCHMPPSSSIDIPHVSITDHFIRKDYSGSHVAMDEYFPDVASILEMKLECLTDEQPNDITMTRGYLAFYERFQSDPAMLDSAAFYLEQSGQIALDERVHHAYLGNDFGTITRLATDLDTSEVSKAWTAYRIGEAFNAIGDYASMLKFYGQAYRLMPLNLRFADKFGIALFKSRKFEEAKVVFMDLIEQNPKVAKHWYNMGYYWMTIPDSEKARIYFEKSLELDPDYQAAIEALNQLNAQSLR